MLPVIVWSPIEQYAAFISSECPKCRMDGLSSQLIPTDWTDGQYSDYQPRLLHCVNSNVILVSLVYHCPNKHCVLAHHPDIIHCFTRVNLHCLVPFHLWHITGFTLTLVDYVDHAALSGIPMQQIEGMLVTNRARLFYTMKETFQQLHPAQFSSGVTNFPEFDESTTLWRMSPKRHAIAACYLQNFGQRESAYHHHMSLTSLTAGSPWLSCDHTFKSVCSVGTVRQADNKWIKQYAGLFCVLNADGQVLSWQNKESHIRKC